MEVQARGAAPQPPPQAYLMGPSGSGRRLHLNEYRHAHAPPVIAAYRQPAAEASERELLVQYPPPPPLEFLRALAAYSGAPGPEWLTVSAGSDEALRALIDTCSLRRQEAVIIGVPTYTHFTHYACLRGLRLHEYQLGLGTPAPTQARLVELCGPELGAGALVYLGSPNNPTGDLWDAPTVAALAARHPRSTFLVDEAYTEFAGTYAVGAAAENEDPRAVLNARTLVPLVRDYPNVVVVRTFSKAFGLAALRIGYAIAQPGTIAQLNLALNPKALGVLSVRVARAALGCLPHYIAAARATVAAAQELASYLRARGWWVHSAPANFFLVHAGDAEAVVASLEARGIYIRNRDTHPGLAGFVRVTAGDPADGEAIQGAFAGLEPPNRPPAQVFYTPKAHIAEMRRLLGLITALLAGRLEVWLESGTLLGAVRHGGIVPWDTDVDLGYVTAGEEADPLRPLASLFAAQGLALQRNRTDAYWQVGTNSPGATISDPHADLFPYLFDAETGLYTCADERYRAEVPDHPDADCNTLYRPDELFPLREIAFHGCPQKIPARAETVLARSLGPDFMTLARARVAGAGLSDEQRLIEFQIRDHAPA